MRAALVIAMALALSRASEATPFTRFTDTTRAVRMTLIRQGLMHSLQTPEAQTEYFLLLCQPRRAWRSAENIADESLRARFEGTILALSAVPRLPIAGEEEVAVRVLPSERVAARFPLDSQEIWADEPADTTVPDTCDFPLAEEKDREALIAAAQAKFSQADSLGKAEDFSLWALETDVGLEPVLSAESEKEFAGAQADSPYLPRLKFFAARTSRDNLTPGFHIKGARAEISPLEFDDVDLIAHRLEIPWLLR